MKIPQYLDKAEPRPPRYICPRCLKKNPDLTVQTVSYFLAATCCKCGAIGTFRRLTGAASEKASETK